MTHETPLPQTPRYGLADLHRVPLLPKYESALERAREVALGSGVWRARKLASLRELFALEQISRLELVAVDPTTELRVLARMPCAVPCLPPGATELVVEERVELAFHYREAFLHGPQPGYSLVDVVAPRDILHPNVCAGPVQHLCLGPSLPRSYPLREGIVASYGALTLQSVTVDERDPAGVMSIEAARYFQNHMDQIPLTREPFLAPPGSSRDAGGVA